MTDGVLVMDKPEGPTSHDVVVLVRRLLHTRQVGHTGTLDPMATGVLALCVGRATRLSRFLTGSRKVYRARVRLGWETDTLDRTGAIVGPRREARADPDRVLAALERLTGRALQVPPSFSAKRIGGVRAYRLARAGEPAEPDPVEVEVEAFRDVSVEGAEIAFEVTCSAGTYVRSLARDLGRALGSGAHLVALRRTRSGEFCLDRAHTPDRLQEMAGRGAIDAAIIPPGRLDLGMPAVHARPAAVTSLAHGRRLTPGDWDGPPLPPGTSCRILGPGGDLLAVAAAEPAGNEVRLQPRVVLIHPEGGAGA